MIAMMLIAQGWADEGTITPVVQVRPRVEAHTGRDGAPDGEQWFVSQRTRLGALAEGGAWSGKVVLQDVRLWGSEDDTLKDYAAGALDLHEGWARYKSESWSLTAGRQEIALDEQRLVGAVDWTQQGRAFDAVRLGLGQGPLSADLAVAQIYDAEAGFQAEDAQAILLRAGYKKDRKDAPPQVADLVSVTERNAATELLRETVGVYAAGATGNLSGRIEAYAQLGSSGDASIFSYMAGLQGTLALQAAMKPRLTLWFDNLSGDDDLTDDQVAAFVTPFATNHKFYGIMDVMCFTTACWVDGRGLRDAALKVDLNPVDQLHVNLDAHGFLAAATQGGDALLGEEVDLWASGPVAKGVTVSGGGSVLLRPDLDPDLWAYLQLDVSR